MHGLHSEALTCITWDINDMHGLHSEALTSVTRDPIICTVSIVKL